MPFLSTTSTYGLRALLYMVGRSKEQRFIGIREMAGQLNISFHFLTKILQTLTQRGLLESYRGPTGGVAFAIPPENIRLAEVVSILEGPDFFDRCLLGLPGCGELAPCPMHRFWSSMKIRMRAEFENTTLAQLGQEALSESLRLSP
jgi:Rrf2 family iron-sulfur cluster assembly transcriptional regulator